MADSPRPLADDSYRLELGGLVARPLRLPLAELQARDTLVATLDCTGGFYSRQRWRGVRLARLLQRAGPLPAASHVRVVSHTGYRWSFDLRDARGLLLATSVGGEPLSHAHGAPARLVAPRRRGFQWVKWVVRIELHDGPDPGAPASTVWSSLDPGGTRRLTPAGPICKPIPTACRPGSMSGRRVVPSPRRLNPTRAEVERCSCRGAAGPSNRAARASTRTGPAGESRGRRSRPSRAEGSIGHTRTALRGRLGREARGGGLGEQRAGQPAPRGSPSPEGSAPSPWSRSPAGGGCSRRSLASRSRLGSIRSLEWRVSRSPASPSASRTRSWSVSWWSITSSIRA